jgi:hypothetical protein
MISKDVTINADVRAPSGETSPKKMVVSLQRAVMKVGGQERTGRWIITKIAS